MEPYADIRYCVIRATFKLIDLKASKDATASSSLPQAIISQIGQTHNEEMHISKALATCETNQFILDGTYSLMPEDVSGLETGWWSEALSEADCTMPESESLTFIFSEPHSSYGLTIFFDTATNNYATAFYVTTYRNGEEIRYYPVLNDSAVCEIILHAEDYDKITITFMRTNLPNRRLRVAEVLFGILENMSNDNIKSASFLREVCLDGSALPISAFSVALDNLDQKYNLINPTGVYKYIQQGQSIDTEIGIGTSRENIEYAKMGKYYCTVPQSSDGGMTAEIEAYDVIYLLDSIKYRHGTKSTTTLRLLVESIVATTGLDINLVFAGDVGDRALLAATPIVTCREALRKAAEATRTVCYVDMLNNLTFAAIEEADSVDVLNGNNMSGAPKVSVPQRYNVVEVEAVTFNTQFDDADVIYYEQFVANGEAEVTCEYSEPAYSQTVTITGGTIVSQRHYLYMSVVTLNGAGNVSLTIKGNKYRKDVTIYRAKSIERNEVEQIKSVSNELILPINAYAVAEWVLSHNQNVFDYELHSRGNPLRDITDTVKIFDQFGENRNAIIKKIQLDFDGGLSEVIEATGGVT